MTAGIEALDDLAGSITALDTQEHRIHLAFNRGTSVSDVAVNFGISRAMAQNRFERWRKNTGDDSVHHPEKAELIHQTLHGKKGLKIYEVCGFKQDGTPGFCTQAFKRYGRVTSLSRAAGDWVQTTRRAILELGVSRRRFDVVDLDGYADGAHVVEAGLFSLFNARGGFFFVTWPSEKAAERWPVVQHRNLVHYGAAQPSVEQRCVFIKRRAYMAGFVSEMIGIRRHGSIIRSAFSMRRLIWDNKNQDKQIAEAQELFG